MTVHIVYFLSTLIGDAANTQAVVRDTAALYESPVKLQCSSSEEANKYISGLPESDIVIVMSAGEEGARFLAEVKAARKDVYAAWSGHQLPEGVDTDVFDRVSLPRGVTTYVQRVRLEGRFTETLGVPHNLTSEALAVEFERKKDTIPALPAGKKKMTVMLGGDAPLPDGTQQFYTAEEATKLARYVARSATEGGYYVYATCGPRTGKFDPETKTEIASAHRGDGPITDVTDAVSRAFKSELDRLGFKDYTFADFRYGNKDTGKLVQSFYQAFLQKSDLFLVPGESTSMVSESSGLVENVIVFLTNSMNLAHERSLKANTDCRKIDVLDRDFALSRSSLPARTEPLETPSAQIARKIKEDTERARGAAAGRG